MNAKINVNELIVIREGRWNWIIYIFCVILLAYCTFFSIRAFRAVRMVLGSRNLIRTARDDGKQRVAVTVIINSVVASLILVFLGIYAFVLTYRDTFAGFTSVRVGENTLTLIYLWPKPARDVPRGAISGIHTRRWGKRDEVLELVTTEGEILKSVSNDAGLIMSAGDDLSRILKKAQP